MGSDEPPGEGGTSNKFRGTVRGQIIQARDVFIVSRPHRRTTLAVLIIAALVATAVIVYRPWSKGSTATASNPPVTSPGATVGPLIGDPRSVDLCPFAQAAQPLLAEYGNLEIDGHYGNFDRCDLLVHFPGGSSEVDVEFQLGKPSPRPRAPRTSSIGTTSVEWYEPDGNGCHRILSTPEPAVIDVRAGLVSGKRIDLCPIADKATSAAAFILGGNVPFPRRTHAPKSLGTLDACALLDARALGSEGIGGASMAGIGNWSCRWGTASGRLVAVRFDQTASLSAPRNGDRIRLGGHDAFVEAEGPEGGDNCLVRIAYRITSGDRGDVWELVRVEFSGPEPALSLCGPARRLAEVVETKLPR